MLQPDQPTGSVAVLALILLLTAAGLPATLDAQTRRSRSDSAALFRGKVVSALTGGPLEEAQVQLPEIRRSTLTDSAGRFAITEVPPGEYAVRVRLIGFAEASTRIELVPEKVTTVTFLLDRNVLRMEDIEVSVPRGPRDALKEFYRRMRRGQGHYITPEEIERRRPPNTSDLLRTVPGVMVYPRRLGKSAVRIRRAAGNRDCPPNLFVDGVLSRSMDLDDINRSDVMAVEIYRGPGETPPEFSRTGSLAGCGTIVVWTRTHGDPGGS